MTQRRRTSGLDRSWLRDKWESLPATENEDSRLHFKIESSVFSSSAKDLPYKQKEVERPPYKPMKQHRLLP